MDNAPLHAAIEQSRIERNRVARIESIIGNALTAILGGCVLFTIVLWVTR
jgi:hypothetical protein